MGIAEQISRFLRLLVVGRRLENAERRNAKAIDNLDKAVREVLRK